MYRTEAEKVIRAAIKALTLSLVAAAISAWLWGVGWNVWVPLLFSASFAIDVIAAYRRLNEPSESGKRGKVLQVKTEAHVPANMKPGEFYEYFWRGGKCYGTHMELRGRAVFIDLRCDALLKRRKQHACQLVSSSEVVANSLDEVKRRAASQSAELALTIEGLEISLIGLYDKSEPDIGEVYFTDESDNDRWTCVLKGTQLSNLSLEN